MHYSFGCSSLLELFFSPDEKLFVEKEALEYVRVIIEHFQTGNQMELFSFIFHGIASEFLPPKNSTPFDKF